MQNENISTAVTPRIYYHVGTGKTGTTFLQYRVFPHFKGIHYVQRTSFKKAPRLIRKGKYASYLLSREYDQQLEDRVKTFSKEFPDTNAIIVFRRHDSYIASQYRRFVKNGYTGTFKTFIDLENDNGYFKKKDLNYNRQIGLLEQHFTQPPLVLIYEDLRKNPKEFVRELASLLNATVDVSQIDFSNKHSSYSEKQLKAMKAVGKYINMRKRRIFKNEILHFLWRLWLGSIRYTILFIARFIPQRFFSKEPLIDPKELEEIKNYFSKDWEECKAHSKMSKERLAAASVSQL
ncbi:MAG: hypothetical protein KDB99_11160 [Chitinophagaceae bacterium]|nr:hypothetical protein [Chitinophagaceae bacterium]